MVKILDQKLQEKVKWNPHSAQKKIIEVFDESRIVVINAGRRFGKSALCAYLVLKILLQPNKKIWIVAPTYDLTLKVFNYLVRWFLLVAPSQRKGVKYRPYPQIKTAQGSLLECKSAENATSLLGEELDLIIVDEASRIPQNIWETYLFPTTSSRQGKTVFISTPLGKNWFYRQFVRAKETNSAFHFRSKDNPNLPAGEWERAKENLPEAVFSQEYEANFLDDAASVFRGVDLIVADNILADYDPEHVYRIGVDLGKHKDYTVITVLDMYNNNIVFIDRFKEIDWNLQKARIIATSKRYGHARITIDSTGVGDPIADDLRRQGVVVDDYSYTNKSKQQLIENLSILIEQQKITIPNDQKLIDEIKMFGYNISDNGRMTYSAPEGEHDDYVNSLALACWGVREPMTRQNLLKKTLQEGARGVSVKRKSFI